MTCPTFRCVPLCPAALLCCLTLPNLLLPLPYITLSGYQKSRCASPSRQHDVSGICSASARRFQYRYNSLQLPRVSSFWNTAYLSCQARLVGSVSTEDLRHYYIARCAGCHACIQTTFLELGHAVCRELAWLVT